MWNLNVLTIAFTSLLGTVSNEDIGKSLRLMGMGMLGIFIVMLVIFLVIVILNKATAPKKDKK